MPVSTIIAIAADVIWEESSRYDFTELGALRLPFHRRLSENTLPSTD